MDFPFAAVASLPRWPFVSHWFSVQGSPLPVIWKPFAEGNARPANNLNIVH